MTDQEKINLVKSALKLIQTKIDSDLSSFKDAVTMHCSRVLHSLVEEMTKIKDDESKTPQEPDEV